MRNLLFGLLCVVVFGGPLYAGVSVSPVITELLLPPGSSYEGKLAVTNRGDVPVVIEASVVGFTAPRGTPIILDPSRDDYDYSGRGLLQVYPDHMEVEPDEVVYFDYKVEMPEELEPYGGRYVAVVFKIRPAASEAQVITTAQVASLFLLNPGGDVAPRFAMRSVEITQDPADPRRVIFKALIANEGNLHINAGQACAMIHILDEDGFIIDKIPIRTHTMLPGTQYTHTEYWLVPEDLPSGTYQFHLSVILFAPVGKQPQHFFYSVPIELTF